MLCVPPFDINKGPKDPPPEYVKFEISKVFFIDGTLIDHVEATMITKILNIPHEVNLTRTDILTYISKGDGFYHGGKKLHLDIVDGKTFIHNEKSEIPRDIQ